MTIEETSCSRVAESSAVMLREEPSCAVISPNCIIMDSRESPSAPDMSNICRVICEIAETISLPARKLSSAITAPMEANIATPPTATEGQNARP